MQAWATWFPDLLPHVPGCPQVVAEHELKRTAQEFFRRTRAWQVSQPLIPVAANTEEVNIVPTDSTQELVRIESVYFDNDRLTPVTPDTLDGWYGDKWESHSGGKPDAWFSVVPGTLRLYPIPLADAIEGLKLRLSVCPSETSDGLPDDIALKFRDIIHTGAKSRLMIYPNKPWTNPQLAVAYGQAFSALADKATADAARSFSNARIPARPKWC